MKQDKNKDEKEEEIEQAKIDKEEEQNDQQIKDTYDFNSLQDGPYSIHLYIEETRNLVPHNKEKALDPMIKVEAFGQTHLSQVKSQRGLGMVFWGEHMFFDKTFDSSEEFEAEKLKISVMDYNMVGFNSVVGATELDLVSIYFSKDHAIEHRWVILNNMSKDFERIMGFLKFSVQVYAKGDKQIVLKDEVQQPKSKSKDIMNNTEVNADGDQFAFGTAELLLPPQIKTTSYNLKITLIKGEQLIKMDWLGSIDPFLIFEFGTSKYKTKTIKDNKNPIWNQIIYIPYSEPMISQQLTIKLFDYDTGRTDEIVGSASFLKNDITNNKYLNHFWMNIYGSQLGNSQKKKQKIMNSCPALASYWKGRILMKIEREQVEKPQQRVEPIPDNELQAYLSKEQTTYTIQADVYYGVEFQHTNEKYSIKIRWADKDLDFPKLKPTDGVWRWYQYLNQEFDLSYKNTKDLPDIFIYLVYGDRLVSYIRKPYSYFNGMLDKEPKMFSFLPDMSKSPNMRDDEAGMIKMKIVVGLKRELDKQPYSHANQSESPSEGNLICNIYNCQNLLPADDDGTSDPFVTINYYGRQVKTQVINDSINPIYNQRLVIEKVPIYKLDGQPPPLSIKVFDDDFIGCDFMGIIVVDLKEMYQKGHLKKNKFEDPTPIWLNFKYGKQKDCGRILVSFQLFDFNNEIFQTKLATIPRNITLKSQKYHIKLRILGLRDLKSLGLLPVKNAFLKFDINSMLPQDKKVALAEHKAIMTEPKESGPNPNLSTIIQFDIELPVDCTYCPHMNVLCYDRIMKGFIQPLLGTFSIDLPHYINKTKDQYFHKIRKATEFLLNCSAQEKKTVNDSIGLGFDFEKQIENKMRMNTESNKANNLGINTQQTIKTAQPQTNKNIQLQDMSSNNDDLNLNLQGESMFEPLIDATPKQSTSNNIILNLDNSSQQISDSKTLIFTEKKPEVVIIPDAIEMMTKNGEITESKCLLQFASYFFNKGQNAIIEEKIPDLSHFKALSWDPKASRLGDKVNKHYRYYVNTALEETVFVDSNTFDEFDIQRGTRIQKKNFFGGLQKPDTLKKVGLFKGWIEIMSASNKQMFKKNLISKLLPGMMGSESSGTQSVASQGSQKSRMIKSTNGKDQVCQKLVKRGQLDSEFLLKQNVIVRIYILECTGLYAMDNDSLSDPYVIIKLGNKVINDVKNFQTDKANCDIYKMFELKCVLPGASQLHVQLWDKDNFVLDDLIGETIIDLENRFFSKQWRNLPYVPIEQRMLTTPTSKQSRGNVQMFLELIPSKETALTKEVWNITPKPAQLYELRVVVWDCEDCPAMDVEDCSDLFVTATVGDEKQTTDVHYRSMTGNGSFNWRMVFPVTLPMQDPSITFSIWDKDIVCPNDFISTGTYPFADMATQAFENDCSVKLKVLDDKKKINLKMPDVNKLVGDTFKKEDKEVKPPLNSKGEDVSKFCLELQNVENADYHITKVVGKLTITMELVPMDAAKAAGVGKGRAEPNHSPWCPPPVGRFKWSWNPCTLFMRLVGPKARAKICCCLCMVLCTAILIGLAPAIGGQIISKILGFI